MDEKFLEKTIEVNTASKLLDAMSLLKAFRCIKIYENGYAHNQNEIHFSDIEDSIKFLNDLLRSGNSVKYFSDENSPFYGMVWVAQELLERLYDISEKNKCVEFIYDDYGIKKILIRTNDMRKAISKILEKCNVDADVEFL